MEDSEGWVNISSEPLGERWASMSEPSDPTAAGSFMLRRSPWGVRAMDLSIQKEACVCACMCMYMYVYPHVCMPTCVCACVFACMDARACVCMNGASALHPEDQPPWSAALLLCEGPGSSETCTGPRGSETQMMPWCANAGFLGDPGSYSPGAYWPPCWCFQGQRWAGREPCQGVARPGLALALPLPNWVTVAFHFRLGAWLSSLTKRR